MKLNIKHRGFNENKGSNYYKINKVTKVTKEQSINLNVSKANKAILAQNKLTVELLVVVVLTTV